MTTAAFAALPTTRSAALSSRIHDGCLQYPPSSNPIHYVTSSASSSTSTGLEAQFKQSDFPWNFERHDRRRRRMDVSMVPLSPSPRGTPKRWMHENNKVDGIDENIVIDASYTDRLLGENTDDDDCDSTADESRAGESSRGSGSFSTTHDTTPSLEVYGIPIQSIILLNLVAVIWGTQHAVIKTVVDGGGEGSTAAYFTLARFGLAAALAAPYTPGWGQQKPDQRQLQLVEQSANGGDTKYALANEKKDDSIITTTTSSGRLAWNYGAELGLYMFLGYAFQAIGLETTTASRSGFLLYLNVKFVPFLSYLIFGRTIRRGTWISAFVAFCGTALLAFDVGGEDAMTTTATTSMMTAAISVGDLWSIAAATSSAMFILRMESASKAVPKSSELNAATLWTVAAFSLLWTMVISLNESIGVSDIGSFASNNDALSHAIQLLYQRTYTTISTHLFPLIYLSGITTALANFLQSKAQKDISAERASVIYAMDPVYGAIFANVLLGETLGGVGLIGAFLIVVAAATNASMDFGGKRGENDET